jgi:NADPH-dependent 2,4-dienoyl-CoA reductase/sulfur reductase-like enzyme
MRQLVRRDLDERGVQVIRSADVFRISAREVHYRLANGEEALLPADAVVVARGYVPDNTLFESLKGGDYALHALGDCVEVGRIRTAIHEAAVVATSI